MAGVMVWIQYPIVKPYLKLVNGFSGGWGRRAVLGRLVHSGRVEPMQSMSEQGN